MVLGKNILGPDRVLRRVEDQRVGAQEVILLGDKVRVGWFNGFSFIGMSSRDLSGRGAARAEDAQGTPTQSHKSPSILAYEE